MLTQLTKSNPEHIGILNKNVAIRTLNELGLKIRFKDFGGDIGRTVTVNCSSGEVVFKLINKQMDSYEK